MSWRNTLDALGVDEFCTRIEIKPYNRTGVKEGVDQLLSARWARISNPRCGPGQTPKHFLIAYTLKPAPSTDATLQMLRVDASTRAIVNRRGWSLSSLPFRLLGDISVPALEAQIASRTCDTLRGTLMEKAITAAYQAQMDQRFKTPFKLRPKHGSATGPDIDHEFAEFLAELAAELQTPSPNAT